MVVLEKFHNQISAIMKFAFEIHNRSLIHNKIKLNVFQNVSCLWNYKINDQKRKYQVVKSTEIKYLT